MFNYNSDGDANYTPVILRQPKAIPSILKDDFIAVRTRSAKFSLSLNRPNKVKHKDKAIQMDTSHSSVSHANQSAIKKPVQSTPNPDEAIQMDTSHSSVSHANQSAIKKPVQSTLNPYEAIQMDTSHSSVSHANQSAIKKPVQSTPNPDEAIQMDTSHSSVSHANQSAIKKPVQSIPNPDKAIQMDTSHSSVSHANQSAIKKTTPNPDKAIQMDTSHSSVSHANQLAIKKPVQSTPNPDEAIQMDTNHSTNSSANQLASKKPVQSVLNPDKVMDTKDLSFNHKKSTPSPHKTTQVDVNFSQPPTNKEVQCNPNLHTSLNYCQNKSSQSLQDSNDNTYSVKTSKQSSDQPHPLKEQLLITQYIQNPKEQSPDGGFKQASDSSTKSTVTLSERSNKQQNMISQLSNTSDNNKFDKKGEVQIAKGLPSSTDTFTSDSDSELAITNPKTRKCITPNKQEQILPKCWEELDSSLQTLLPNIDKVTYVIENHKDREQLSFEGAPKSKFDLVVRINLDNRDQASDFLNKMMKHSYCTYRISRTSKKPALK